MLLVDFSWWQQLVAYPATWFVLGVVCCWSFLTVLPQGWTDWITRQEYFGIILGIVGLAFLVFLVLPSLTLGMVIGVLGSIIFFIAASKWFKKFKTRKEKKEEEK
ncbi:hypothetical protein ACFL15_01700 [Patescibacteria group bacterium]